MAKTLIIGDYTLTAEFDISLSQKREIFEEPQARGGERTLSVKVVGNDNSNQCFGFYFNANAEGFDPRKRVDALLYDDNTPYFEGIAKLVEVVRLRDKVTYTVIVFGKIIDLFSELGDRSIRDLTLPDYTHLYTQESINNSIQNLNRIGGSNTAVSDGVGYRYINGNFGEYAPRFVRRIRPAYYVKELFTAAISDAGFRLQSDFISSDPNFEKIGIINSGDWERTATEVEALSVRASRTTDLLTQSFDEFLFDNVILDPSSAFSAGIFTAPETGLYTFDGVISYNLVFASSRNLQVGNNNFFHPMLRLNGTGGNYSQMLAPVTYAANTTVVATDASSIVASAYSFEDVPLQQGQTVFISFTTVTRANSDLSFIPTNNQTANSGRAFEMNVRTGSTFRATPNTDIDVGASVTTQNSLPDIKVRDFMKWVMNMFNLVLDYDKQDPKKVIIEPYDDYLSDTVVELDIDISKDIVTRPIPDELSGNWILSYEDAEDIVSTRYQSRFEEVFGTKEKLSENEFVRGSKRIGVGFHIAPFYRISEDDKLITSLSNADNEQAGGTYIGFIKNDIPCQSYSVLEPQTGHTVGLNLTRYSYMGNLNDPDNATMDLSFAPPRAMYHFSGGQNTTATDATLYNLYWRKRIARYQNASTKMLSAFIHVTKPILNILTFEKLYFLNNQYYRLLEINNYKGAQETTQLLFVSELFVPDFEPEQKTVDGGSDTFTGGDQVPNVINIGSRYQGDIGYNNAGTVAKGLVAGSPDGGQGVGFYNFGGATPYGTVAMFTTVDTMAPNGVYVHNYELPKMVEFTIGDIEITTGLDIQVPVDIFDTERMEVTEMIIKSSGPAYSNGAMRLVYDDSTVLINLPAPLLTTTGEYWKLTPTSNLIGAGELFINFTSVPTESRPLFTLTFQIKYRIIQ